MIIDIVEMVASLFGVLFCAGAIKSIADTNKKVRALHHKHFQ